MSFILDALRKSDARRRQGETPGLHTPEPDPPPKPRRRVLPTVLVGLLVCALAVGGVYLSRPDWLTQYIATTAEDPQGDTGQRGTPAVTDADDPSRSGGPDERAGGQSVEDEQAPTPPSADDERREIAAAESDAAANSGDGDDPATRERESDRRGSTPAPADRSVSRPAPQRESRPVTAEEGTRELERRMARAEERRNQARERAGGGEETEPEREREARASDDEPPDPSQPSSTRVEARPLNADTAEYLHVWELPLSVRRNLPDLELTIHVYSPQEARRFVLINGERYVVGDQIGEAELVAIEREGAVVDFQSHRFLLEPR